jgi:hypothetical protein
VLGAPGVGAEAPCDRQGSSSLEIGTKLVPPCSATVYKAAGEASVWVNPDPSARYTPRKTVDPLPGDGRANAERAARRAQAKLRRYCKANLLSRHMTVTYAPAFERSSRYQVLRDVAAFRRRLYEWVGHRIPMAAVPEQGTKNGRWHCEIAIGVYVPQRVLQGLWGFGWVNIHRYGDRHKQQDEVQAAWQVASYLSKYVGKALVETAGAKGGHRYEVSQGFQPQAERLDVWTFPEGIAQVVAVFEGELPRSVWRSSQVDGWLGPPVWCGYW